jgi:hypothetical protein
MFSCRYIKEAQFAFLTAEIKGTWTAWRTKITVPPSAVGFPAVADVIGNPEGLTRV